MQKITPFLWFDEQAEEAANFYTAIFQNGKVNSLTRFGAEMPGPEGKAMTVSFELAGLAFNALNGGPEYHFTPAISFFVYCQRKAEIDTLWAHLSEGGSALMELGEYPFNAWYGWIADRYGVSWQLFLDADERAQRIAPCLLFVGEQNQKAEEAMRFYTSLFENSSIQMIDRYGPEHGEQAGAVMHAQFTLNGQAFVAMDSNLAHEFTFTPATSFYVHCQNQDEVDYYWEKLTDGGAEVQCGWLVDRFGVSWQVVPDELLELMSDPDAERAGRVTQAMLKMIKIDIGQLRQAYAQEA